MSFISSCTDCYLLGIIIYVYLINNSYNIFYKLVTGAATIDIEKDSKTYNFDLPQEDSASNDTSNLDSAQNESTKHAIWTFAYYQQFFDVDTNTVIQNIKDSLNPVAHVNRNKKYFGGKSDLYGPVWICATLVVVISVFGNLNYVFNRWTDHKDYKYTPQFEKVSFHLYNLYFIEEILF